jgi:hypothetical protein
MFFQRNVQIIISLNWENNNRVPIHHFSNWGKQQSSADSSFFQLGKTTIECQFIIFPIGENNNRETIHHFSNWGKHQSSTDSSFP